MVGRDQLINHYKLKTMKKFKYSLSALIISSIFLIQSCVEAEDLVTTNVASPVLIMFQGSAFSGESPINVGSTFLELDKTHLLDHSRGIDSIPVANLEIKVMINHVNEIATLTTDQLGKAVLTATWDQLGLTSAKVGDQVRLEFTGTHKAVAFRKYHTIRVN